MTTGDSDDVKRLIASSGRILGAAKMLAVAAFALGLWVAKQEFQGRDEILKVAAIQSAVDSLVLWRVETAGNRFTMQDGLKQQQQTSDRLYLQAERIQRLEDAIIAIKDSLVRIESKTAKPQ